MINHNKNKDENEKEITLIRPRSRHGRKCFHVATFEA